MTTIRTDDNLTSLAFSADSSEVEFLITHLAVGNFVEFILHEDCAGELEVYKRY